MEFAQMQLINATAAKESGAPAGILSSRESTVSSPLAALRRWYRWSLLRLLLLELRNLIDRIQWVSRIHAAERLRGLDSTRRWMDEALIPPPRSRQHAYIADMREIESKHPFLSVFDLLLLSKAWRAGSEWKDRSEDTSQSPDK